RPRIADERKARLDASLLQPLRFEKIEIDRDAMTQMERDGGPAVQHERQLRCGSELRPDFLLGQREDFNTRIKPIRHRTTCEEVPRESDGWWRASDGRAKTPRNVRRSTPVRRRASSG